jgi:hypothetical protein
LDFISCKDLVVTRLYVAAAIIFVLGKNTIVLLNALVRRLKICFFKQTVMLSVLPIWHNACQF